MNDLFEIIGQLGFPIFVAVYLLVRMEVLIRKIVQVEHEQQETLVRLSTIVDSLQIECMGHKDG